MKKYAVLFCLLAAGVAYGGEKVDWEKLKPYCESENTSPALRMPVPDGYKFPEKIRRMDPYKDARFDLNGDGNAEQFTLTGGGSGGESFYIHGPTGWKLAELFGSVWIAEKKNGYYQLIVETRCGWSPRYFRLYRYEPKNYEYECIREEEHHYDTLTVKITKGGPETAPAKK